MKKTIPIIFAAMILFAGGAAAAPGDLIPAPPVITFYQFSGKADVPYYDMKSFLAHGPSSPAGTLAQGSSVVPCIVMRDGAPNGDAGFAGIEIIVDARRATPADAERFRAEVEKRRTMRVENHHCGPEIKYIANIRDFFPLEKPPFFDPPRSGQGAPKEEAIKGIDSIDSIVRAFHSSAECEEMNRSLTGRREALDVAWDRFIASHGKQWPAEELSRARQLDFAMRTALFEGHIDRGCSAYGACERDIIALSIRNRGREGCNRGQGCGFQGDFEGVATRVSQYNIWDEFLTQISGIGACFMRPDAKSPQHDKLRAMYEQNVRDVEKILFGGDEALEEIFPGTSAAELKALRHYYHAPAMGKCFPGYPRAEYITAAIATKGKEHALIVNTRVHADDAAAGGYHFRSFVVTAARDRDDISLVDNYPGYVLDARNFDFKASGGCTPYGVSRSCSFKEIGRYRKTPSWYNAGHPMAVQCRIEARGDDCAAAPKRESVKVGGACDPEMQPFAGVR